MIYRICKIVCVLLVGRENATNQFGGELRVGTTVNHCDVEQRRYVPEPLLVYHLSKLRFRHEVCLVFLPLAHTQQDHKHAPRELPLRCRRAAALCCVGAKCRGGGPLAVKIACGMAQIGILEPTKGRVVHNVRPELVVREFEERGTVIVRKLDHLLTFVHRRVSTVSVPPRVVLWQEG